MALHLAADVPFGNACDVEIVESGGVTEVSFAPDPHGGPEVMWFAFRLQRSGGAPGGRIRLKLKNMANILGGDNARNMRPVAATDGASWQRLDEGRAEGLDDGRVNVSWEIDAPGEFLDVAWCYPYGPGELEALVRETCGFYHADTIGVSQAGRPIVRLSNSPSAEGSDRAGLYLIARQHSGETPGSWVLDGFLRHMASLGDDAPLAWAVPLSNIDGVVGGDYGKDNFPYDLNRAWGSPAMRHETLVIRRDMERWKARCRAALALDFHAPGACEAEGIYAFVVKPEDSARHFRTSKQWAERFAEALGEDYAATDFARLARYGSRWGTPGLTHFCARELDVCGLSLETPYALSACGRVLLSKACYREAGERLAAAAVEGI